MSTDEYIKQSLTNIVKAIKNNDETRLVAHVSALKFLIHLMDNTSMDTLLPDIMSLVTSPSRDVQRRGVEIIKELGISPGEFAAQLVVTMETVNASEPSPKRSLDETDKEQNPKRKVPVRLGTVTPVSRAAGIQPSIPPVDDEETDCED
ncbi:hypothetical protein EXVG_00139 [Emiliania huxleyi virus 202]|nr:hypothetical protein EXVG_00139 [Emiliania huxleyi virus 202]AHA54063.1 hypothetical protein EhV18_00012 [Emiliania huxleyi virus 18]AHA55113.1 hypothetical protein EhV156_00012 [Emiliania huxleyi virus 156]